MTTKQELDIAKREGRYNWDCIDVWAERVGRCFGSYGALKMGRRSTGKTDWQAVKLAMEALHG